MNYQKYCKECNSLLRSTEPIQSCTECQSDLVEECEVKDVRSYFPSFSDELKQLRLELGKKDEVIAKLKSALSITLVSYSDFADDEEDEDFIDNCRNLIKGNV